MNEGFISRDSVRHSDNGKVITIGVPTYNRYKEVKKLLLQVLDEEILDIADVLVIDDGSPDDTYEKLMCDERLQRPGLVVERNDNNMGYSYTFGRLFELCRTQYLLMMADDDLLIVESFPDLIEFLVTKHPLFVSPHYIRNGHAFRGRDETRPIVPREFRRACNHAPGLVYNVPFFDKGLEVLKKRRGENKSDAVLYPQVVVSFIAMIEYAQGFFWLDLPVVKEGAGAPSGITDGKGDSYVSVSSRWRQCIDFNELFVEHDCNEISREVLNHHQERVFHHIYNAMKLEDHEVAESFNQGGRRYNSIHARVFRVLKDVALKPGVSIFRRVVLR